ncbi:hypothetical protein Acr_22g0004570 [Actinidia rufa]|uniref:Uncharacterized protein n=1 Tax=Actinidia rufa TaxID=165716 RepID=A0A7J0GJR8_9ERIC|nr:hypothetical protein Acr_22g0004570 [Actinidia rufa]
MVNRDWGDFFERFGILGLPGIFQNKLFHLSRNVPVMPAVCGEISSSDGSRGDRLDSSSVVARGWSYKRGAVYTMKSCQYGGLLWFGSQVIGKLIHPKGCVVFPPNQSGGMEGCNLSSPIFIFSKPEMNKMSAELPLSIRISGLKLAMTAETTKASSWAENNPRYCVRVPVEFTIFVPVLLWGLNSGGERSTRTPVIDRLNLGRVSCISSPPCNQLASYQVLFSYDPPFLVACVWPRPTPLRRYTCRLCSRGRTKSQEHFWKGSRTAGQVGAFFCRFLQLMKLATKSRLSSPKESTVPGSLNFEEIRVLNTLSVNGGSVCLTGRPRLWSISSSVNWRQVWHPNLESSVRWTYLVPGVAPSMRASPPSYSGSRLTRFRRGLRSRRDGLGAGAYPSLVRRSNGPCPESRRDPRKDEYGKISRRIGDIIGKIASGDIPLEMGVDQAKYSTSQGKEEKHFGSGRAHMSTLMVALASSVEMTWRGSELNVGLVLPRSRGFRDKQPLERSRATSSVKALGRGTCLS